MKYHESHAGARRAKTMRARTGPGLPLCRASEVHWPGRIPFFTTRQPSASRASTAAATREKSRFATSYVSARVSATSPARPAWLG